MAESRRWHWFASAFFYGLMLCLLVVPALADGDRGHKSDPPQPPPEAHGGDGGAGGHGGAGGEGGFGIGYGGKGGEGGRSSAQAVSSNKVAAGAASESHGGEGGEGGHGGGGGSSNVKNRSTSIVLTGSKDTADCFTKMGIGAEGFGIFWSRSDPYCKKVRLIASHIDRGNFAAAARLECTLGEWQEVYGHKRARNKDGSETEGYRQCQDDLVPVDEPSPVGGVFVPAAEYDELLAQVSEEELEEKSQLLEDRIAQQQNLIDTLKEEHKNDEAEIERLRREADALRAAERAREQRETKQQSALQAILEKRAAQEIRISEQYEDSSDE